MQLPTRLAFDAAGRLWAAGGPLLGDGADRLCLGVAQHSSEGDDCQVPDLTQTHQLVSRIFAVAKMAHVQLDAATASASRCVPAWCLKHLVMYLLGC